jgi:tetratricopeptide (TPR) repeat protein
MSGCWKAVLPAGGAATAFVAIALAATVQGCGLPLIGHRADVRGPAPERSRYDAHREALEHVSLEPGEPYWHHRLAQLRLAADSTGAAEASLRAALSCDPLYAPAMSLLGRLYFDQGRHVEGIAVLEPARTRAAAFAGGVPPELLAGLALHYAAAGRGEEARAVLATAPGGARAIQEAGTYLALRDAATDSAAATAVAGRAGHGAAGRNNRGIALLRAGDAGAARAEFLAAIELDPSLPGPYYNLAILERFYALDDDAGVRWFAEYRRRAASDPDGLAEAFAAPGARDVAGKEAQP